LNIEKARPHIGGKMEYKSLKYELKDSVAVITLNRPEVLNAMDRDMFNELNDVFTTIAADLGIRAVLLTGQGRGFCSGADLRSLATAPDVAEPAAFKSYMRIINDVILKMLRLDRPIVAAVNGPATGAGANLALASDIIFMARDAYLSQIFVKRGLVPDFGGLYLLPRYVGLAKAKELLFTGDNVDGDEAVRLGMANRSLAPEKLMPEAMEFAQKLASGPTVAIGLAKQGVHRGLESGVDALLEFEALAQSIIRTTGDTFEAITAFLEKREPDFKGK
jgi:2-(1,2-epoxy-1,2-dihydrophenyl)acetyl-CoA isomerase